MENEKKWNIAELKRVLSFYAIRYEGHRDRFIGGNGEEVERNYLLEDNGEMVRECLKKYEDRQPKEEILEYEATEYKSVTEREEVYVVNLAYKDIETPIGRIVKIKYKKDITVGKCLGVEKFAIERSPDTIVTVGLLVKV